jgi:hypothetical protein
MKSRKQEASSGATLAMLSILPHSKLFRCDIPSANKLPSENIRLEAVKEGVVETLVNRLKNPKTCLFAAYALSLTLDHRQSFNP